MNVILKIVIEVQEFALLTVQALLNIFRSPRYLKDMFIQMDMIGVGSVVIVILTGFFTGGVLALQSASSLQAFGL